MIDKVKNKIRRGFTLIETLVAVLLLATAIAGPLTLASKGLTAALIAKDQITAFYLAQDGVEQIRFLRDTNRLTSPTGDWFAGLTNCISANGCYLDSLNQNPATPQPCNDATCSNFPLYYNASSHQFTYSTSGTARTIFTRSISITNPVGGNPEEAALTVTVRWSDTAGITRSVVLRDNLFDWQ